MVDRKKLDEIIMKNNTNDWWRPDLFLKHTKHLLPAELEIVANPPPEDRNYNCFLFALGLHTHEEILKETNGFIYDSFIQHLLSVGHLEKTGSPTMGDFIVYQDTINYPNSLTHTGIFQGDNVLSKWARGPLVRHAIWDVPAEYGDSIFYIKSIDTQQALHLYHLYKACNRKPFT